MKELHVHKTQEMTQINDVDLQLLQKIDSSDTMQDDSIQKNIEAKTKSHAKIIMLYVCAEIFIIPIHFALTVALSIILAILSGDYTTASFIGWFLFIFIITSFIIYLLFLICKKHRSANNFNKFTKIRWTIFTLEFLLFLVIFQVLAAMIAPNSTIFPNIYSSNISLNSVEYNQTVNMAKKFFDCNLNLDFHLRDISDAPISGDDSYAYVIGDTIHTVHWLLYESPHSFVHECSHIWQFRNGVFDGITGFNTIMEWYPPLYPDDYDYGNLTEHRLNGLSFGDLGIEQQAEIIADYFLYITSNYTIHNGEQSPLDLEYYATQTVIKHC